MTACHDQPRHCAKQADRGGIAVKKDKVVIFIEREKYRFKVTLMNRHTLTEPHLLDVALRKPDMATIGFNRIDVTFRGSACKKCGCVAQRGAKFQDSTGLKSPYPFKQPSPVFKAIAAAAVTLSVCHRRFMERHKFWR